MAWLGLQGDVYLVPDAVSPFLGLGFTPEFVKHKPKGFTPAAGLRGYTTGRTHRSVLQLSYSQLTVSTGSTGERIYGPGLSLGYLYIARIGLMVHVSAGAGYVGGHPDGDDDVVAIGGMGVGYTWRR